MRNAHSLAKTEPGRRAISLLESISPQLEIYAGENDPAGKFAIESFRLLRENGLLSVCAPVESGGVGLTSLHDLTLFIKYLAKADASAAVASQMHLVLSWYFARTVRLGGDAHTYEKHKGWCDEIGNGRMVVASAVSEHGSLPWTPSSQATRVQNGWLINGRKNLVSNSPAASHFYTRVRIDEEGTPSIATAMIPREIQGVTVVENWDGLGLRGSGSGDVIFDGCFVPASAVTIRGEWGKRDDRSLEGRVASTAPLLGIPMGLIEAARSHCSKALQNKLGRSEHPLSATEVYLVSEVEVLTTSARSALTMLLSELDDRLTQTRSGTLSAIESRQLMSETAIAGILLERAVTEVIDLSMQILGGAAYRAGHPLARFMRDARALFYMRPIAPPNKWRDFLVNTRLQDELSI